MFHSRSTHEPSGRVRRCLLAPRGGPVLGTLLVVQLALSGCADERVGRSSAEIFTPHDGPFPREGECNIDDPIFDAVRRSIHKDQNIGPDSLKHTAIPEPDDIANFVRDRGEAIALGKALFWDMQVSSDGIQACGSCHFRAGADPRSRNQVAPGGAADATGHFEVRQPNGQLSRSDFPTHKFADPFDRTSAVLRSSDDVISSQGVFRTLFESARPGRSRDRGTILADAVFQVDGKNTRIVQARNTPTMINAVFNQRNFWDGRADNIFNGVNPFGARDPDARVARMSAGGHLDLVKIRLNNASLASQAVGPPESTTEMSFIGRTFRDLGRRLLTARPLRGQRVHPRDSVFVGRIHQSGKGLRGRYKNMVRRAFRRKWWKSDQIVVVEGDGTVHTRGRREGDDRLAANEYSMMEYNFSLYFGLAVQMYEATLVSDDAKIDRHFDSLRAGGAGVLSAVEQEGLELFRAAGCADCHSGPEFSGAVVRTTTLGFDNPNASIPFDNDRPTFQPPEQIERMVVGSCDVKVYDQGFYNIGVRPFEDDPGIAANDPFGNPLSIAVLKTMNPADVPSPEILDLYYSELGDIGAVPRVAVGEPTAIQGAFKIPGLRNVELTAPYFHNGSRATLRQVVEFYNRGGDFHDHIGTNGVAQDEFMDLVIGRLELTDDEIDKIVIFLRTLTDERVVSAAAPFDHPELFVPNGHRAPRGDDDNDDHADDGAVGKALKTRIMHIPAVGRDGGEALPGFLE